VKARKLGVLCPALYYVDLDMSALYMEHISGKSVKELLLTQALDEAGEPCREHSTWLREHSTWFREHSLGHERAVYGAY
jgi:hypothetical protein